MSQSEEQRLSGWLYNYFSRLDDPPLNAEKGDRLVVPMSRITRTERGSSIFTASLTYVWHCGYDHVHSVQIEFDASKLDRLNFKYKYI